MGIFPEREREKLIADQSIPKTEVILEYSINKPIITLINKFPDFLSQF